ncbi:MAG: outer membrane protein [Mesorhizobium sp.]
MTFKLALAALLLSSTSVYAADAVVGGESLPEAPVASFTWTGAYIGAHAGYGWGHTEDTNNPAANRKNIDGFIGGIQAGYNHQLDNNVVLGVEATLDFGNVKNTWDGENEFDPYYTKDEVNGVGTLRARLGYAVDRFLPYITGGVAVGHSKHVLGCSPAHAPGGTLGCATPFEDSGSDWSVGYVVGAGAEYAVTENWTIRAEYNFTDLGKTKMTLTDPNYPAAINAREFDTKFSTVNVGINYKF